MERFVGLDLGTKSLGIATSDSLGIVHPRENFNFEKNNYKKAREHLIDFLEIENITNIVIGLPIRLEGFEGDRCESVRRFATDLKNDYNLLNIHFQDESYSTIEARERLQNQGMKEEKIKTIIDMMSAVVILEDFINNLKGVTNGNFK